MNPPLAIPKQSGALNIQEIPAQLLFSSFPNSTMDLIEYAYIRKDAMLQFLKTSGMGGYSCLAFGNLSTFYNFLKRYASLFEC